MEKINQSTLDFLKQLKKNNNRDWFTANRPLYVEAKTNFESFIQQVIDNISKFDPILKGLEAGSCIFRINRDIRFSSDKSPYKTNMGASIVRGGRKNGERFTGYYVHIEPGGNCFIAGGAYMPSPQWLTAIREKIADDPDTFKKIIRSKDFIKYFGNVRGDRLKSAPKGYTSDHPAIDYLKYKNYYVMHEISEKDVLSPTFLSRVVEVSKAMRPFNDFLNATI